MLEILRLMLKVGFIVILLCVSNLTFSQGTESSNIDSVRFQYIHEFHDRFYIKPIVTVRSLSLELADNDKQVASSRYKPSSNNFLGLGLYFFDLGIELSFKLPQDENQVPPEIFGETESIDFQTNIYAKKWGGDLSYQEYEGMYLENPDDHMDGWQNGDPFPIRNDLQLRNIQANGFYVFNHERFSYRSPYIQADQQLKSQGSLQLGLFFSHFRFAADSSLIPGSAQSAFPENGDISKAKITTLAILPGYTYTLTWKNIYLNAALAVGPGQLWTTYFNNEAEEEKTGLRPVANLRGALGYNGNWYFMGITAVNQIVSSRIDNLDVNSTSANIKLFFGIRFKEKGFLTKELL